MIKFLMVLLFPVITMASPGYYGEVKIVAKNGDIFIVEQAGHRLEVDAKRLPVAQRQLWPWDNGKTFEGGVPYKAIESEKPIKGYKPPKEKNR